MEQLNGGTVYCCPDRAQYTAGESVRIEVHPYPGFPEIFSVRLYRLHEELPCVWTADGAGICIGMPKTGSYGVRIETELGAYETAFDVVDTVKAAVRYGFLSDFSPVDTDACDVDWLNRLHLNTVQFYDWMYRHDRLLSPTEEYEDPIGRSTALSVVRDKINACLVRGMRPFAYGAVYAATEDTYLKHPEWAAYMRDKEPLLFSSWLHYMNIAPGSGWSKHILNEFRNVVETLGFAGIHMDTYGFPKRIYDAEGNQVMLEDAFSPLIDAAQETVAAAGAENGVIFNAVNDWPTEKVAKANQDAVYIEVWPPYDTYRDLYLLVRKARAASQKPVVLAAYMRPFQNAKAGAGITRAEYAFRLANAVIMASGGTQLVFGEDQGLLCDSYYANYAKLRPQFVDTAVRYSDFLVRYAPLLYDDSGLDVSMTAAGGINEDVIAEADGAAFSVDGREGAVWMILRESEKRLTVHLVNLTGNDAQWNTGKDEPPAVRDIRLKLRLDADIKGAYAASPDTDTLEAVDLPVETKKTDFGRVHTVVVPELICLTTIWIEME